MTRKDFVALARIIREEQLAALADQTSQTTITRMKETARRMADYFELQNANFDRSRFMEACGF